MTPAPPAPRIWKPAVQRNEDALLGKLAVREGFCSQEQIDECLRMQSASRSAAPLGDLLLFKGYLTATRLKDLLSRQNKKIMNCPSCRLSYTVLTLSEGKSARCPRCKGLLENAAPKGPTHTDAEITTQRMRMTPSIAPAARQPSGKVKMVCVICDQGFEWTPDPSGRVRCPSCMSVFTSKK